MNLDSGASALKRLVVVGLVVVVVAVVGGACRARDDPPRLDVTRPAADLPGHEVLIMVSKDGRLLRGSGASAATNSFSKSTLEDGAVHRVDAVVQPCSDAACAGPVDFDAAARRPTCSKVIQPGGRRTVALRLTVVSATECQFSGG